MAAVPVAPRNSRRLIETLEGSLISFVVWKLLY
jgi:hypothetical protein